MLWGNGAMQATGRTLRELIEELKQGTDASEALIQELEETCERDEKAMSAAKLQVIRAERLQLAGTIAAQIAHDFRNLLSPILLLPQILRRSLPKEGPYMLYLTEMEKAARDMLQMTEDLSVLSSRGRTAQDLVNLNETVRQLVELLGPKAAVRNIETCVLPEPALLNIKGVADQLLRALQNLYENAMDAMKTGGKLTVKTENVYLDEPFGEYDTVRVGEYVKVTVSDTGEGIPEDIRDKIFDPFFTTKKSASQRSSGLGLSIVHSVVKDHHGYIDLESTVGKGTRFSLFFPICRDQSPSATTADLPGGAESVLVVDDDFQQVELLMLLLTMLGYHAKGVHGGREALRFLKEDKVDLVILDIVMPEMDGVETCKKIRKMNSRQPVIIISGFDKSPAIDDVKRMGVTMCLKKPVTLEELAPAVRTELDKQVRV